MKTDVVFIQVMGNDTKHDSVDWTQLARYITSFAEFIIDCYNVKHIIIGQFLVLFLQQIGQMITMNLLLKSMHI